MRINTLVTNIEKTPAIENYLEKKLEALSKFIDPADESAVANVEIGKTTHHHRSGDVFKAEINLEWSGRQYYANAEKDDLYAAIDIVKDEIIRELKNSKQKRDTLLRRGGQKLKNLFRGFRRNGEA